MIQFECFCPTFAKGVIRYDFSADLLWCAHCHANLELDENMPELLYEAFEAVMTDWIQLQQADDELDLETLPAATKKELNQKGKYLAALFSKEMALPCTFEAI